MRHEHDTHVFEDGRKIRALNNSVLIKPDPAPTHSASGLIEYAQGAMEHVLNTGTILAFGARRMKNGKWYPIDDLEVGKKVGYIRFVEEQDSNKQLRKRYDGVVRLKDTDILVVFDPEDADRVNK
jgi:co-chaperonin GroES (HSP10)